MTPAQVIALLPPQAATRGAPGRAAHAGPEAGTAADLFALGALAGR